MQKIFEIPLSPDAQTFTITLAGVRLRLTVVWNEAAEYWTLTIADEDDVILLTSLPLVPGLDLLRQHYSVLDLPGYLVVQVDGDPHAIPTYENLGTLAHLFFVTVP